MDFVEGVGESCSPPRTFSGFSNYDVRNDVYNRLVETGHDQAVSNPEFREQLEEPSCFGKRPRQAPRLPYTLLGEYMPGGSLYDYLYKNHNVMELSQVLKFAIDVCKGMEYLHRNNIIHRDLKTANLLMDTNNVVKMADFGVARFLNQGGVMTAETGTYRWMAPEVINHQPYDPKADIFSFSIVLWELVTAKVPYDTMTPLQAALGVRQGLRPELPKHGAP